MAAHFIALRWPRSAVCNPLKSGLLLTRFGTPWQHFWGQIVVKSFQSPSILSVLDFNNLKLVSEVGSGRIFQPNSRVLAVKIQGHFRGAEWPPKRLILPSQRPKQKTGR